MIFASRTPRPEILNLHKNLRNPVADRSAEQAAGKHVAGVVEAKKDTG
jgi:hypothetical protein